ncbi:hypothetical protein M0Q97_07925 [Candidatus Dojkabacteria bacterium]|jgi:hypothetical protein|nr:hypothetical protein [Candidatus Dojkabacteria bacterium]
MKLYHQMMIQQELFEYVLFKQSFVELDSDVHSDDFILKIMRNIILTHY